MHVLNASERMDKEFLTEQVLSDEFEKLTSVTLEELYMPAEKAGELLYELMRNYVGHRQSVEMNDVFGFKLRKMTIVNLMPKADPNVYYEILFNESFVNKFNLTTKNKWDIEKYLSVQLQARANSMVSDQTVNLTELRGTSITLYLPEYMTFKQICNIAGFSDFTLHYDKGETTMIISPELSKTQLEELRKRFDIPVQNIILTSQYARIIPNSELRDRFKKELAKLTGIHISKRNIDINSRRDYKIITWTDEIKLNEYFINALYVIDTPPSIEFTLDTGN